MVQSCILKGHSKSVSCLDISRNYVFSGSADKTVRVWDMNTLQTVHILKGHKDEVTCLQAVDNVLFTGSLDKTVCAYNLLNGQRILQYKAKGVGPVQCLLVSSGRLFTGHGDGLVCEWNNQAGVIVRQFKSPGQSSLKGVRGITLDNANGLLFVGGNSGLINVFSLSTPTDSKGFAPLIQSFSHEEVERICSIKYHNNLLYVGGSRPVVAVFNSQTGECVSLLSGHTGPVTSLLVRDNMIVSTSADRTARTWHTRGGERLCCVRGHDDWVKCCALQDGMLITGGDDCTVRLWKLDEGPMNNVREPVGLMERLKIQHEQQRPAYHMQVDSASGVSENVELESLERQRRTSCDFSVANSAADSGIGSIGSHRLLKTDIVEQAPDESKLNMLLTAFMGLTPALKSQVMYKFVAEANTADKVVIREILERSDCCDIISKVPVEIACHIGQYLKASDLKNATCVSWSWYHRLNDPALYRNLCKRIVSSTLYKQYALECQECPELWKPIYRNREIVRRNFATGKVQSLMTLEGHTEPIYALCVDKNMAVSASEDHTLRVWDLASGMCVRALEGHEAGVLSCIVSEQFIISGSYDNSVKVWDRKTGLCLLTLRGHTAGVCGVEVNGSRILSSSFDCTTRVWNVSTGALDAVLAGHNHYVYCAVSDGDTIISGCHDGTVKCWELVPSPQALPGSAPTTPFVGVEKSSFRCHKFAVRCMSFSRPYLVTGSLEKEENVRVWNVMTGILIKNLSIGDCWVRSVSFSPFRIVCAGDNHDVMVVDSEMRGAQYSLKGHSSIVSCVSSDDNRIVSASFDKTIKVWNFQN
eukprot:Nk52_evm93s158 gene=Nk52_evmTU93s158